MTTTDLRGDIARAIAKGIRDNMPVDLMGKRMDQYALIWASASTAYVTAVLADHPSVYLAKEA